MMQAKMKMYATASMVNALLLYLDTFSLQGFQGFQGPVLPFRYWPN